MITTEDIESLANLARIDVKDEEKEHLRSSMEGILNYVSEVGKISSDDGSAVSAPEAGALRNVFREDGEPHESGIYTDGVLENAPGTEGEYIKVKKIL